MTRLEVVEVECSASLFCLIKMVLCILWCFGVVVRRSAAQIALVPFAAKSGTVSKSEIYNLMNQRVGFQGLFTLLLWFDGLPSLIYQPDMSNLDFRPSLTTTRCRFSFTRILDHRQTSGRQSISKKYGTNAFQKWNKMKH